MKDTYSLEDVSVRCGHQLLVRGKVFESIPPICKHPYNKAKVCSLERCPLIIYFELPIKQVEDISLLL